MCPILHVKSLTHMKCHSTVMHFSLGGDIDNFEMHVGEKLKKALALFVCELMCCLEGNVNSLVSSSQPGSA